MSFCNGANPLAVAAVNGSLLVVELIFVLANAMKLFAVRARQEELPGTCAPIMPGSPSARSSSPAALPSGYMAGDLLGREVTAEDVAQAFPRHAVSLKTTADVTTLDGGTMAAALR